MDELAAGQSLAISGATLIDGLGGAPLPRALLVLVAGRSARA